MRWKSKEDAIDIFFDEYSHGMTRRRLSLTIRNCNFLPYRYRFFHAVLSSHPFCQISHRVASRVEMRLVSEPVTDERRPARPNPVSKRKRGKFIPMMMSTICELIDNSYICICPHEKEGKRIDHHQTIISPENGSHTHSSHCYFLNLLS